MLTVVCSTESFHVVGVFPKGATLDTDYYCEDILSEMLFPKSSKHVRQTRIADGSLTPKTRDPISRSGEKNS
jgi:hypothetical protein